LYGRFESSAGPVARVVVSCMRLGGFLAVIERPMTSLLLCALRKRALPRSCGYWVATDILRSGKIMRGVVVSVLVCGSGRVAHRIPGL